MRLEIALCLPRDAETVAVVRAIVTDALRRVGVAEDSLDAVRLALSEACTNVIDHSGAEDEYEVRLRVEDARCEIRIIDTGHGFDGDALVDGSDGGDADVASPRGRGIAIMRAVIDHVQLDSRPESGTVVHLVTELALDPDGTLARTLGH